MQKDHVLAVRKSRPQEGDSSKKHHFIETIRQLDEEEVEFFNEAKNILERYEHYAQIFLIVVWNYEDYENGNSFVAKAMINERQKGIEFLARREPYLDTNRMILNLLSSIRTYLDHTETMLKRVYGKDSEIVTLLKSWTSSEYDNNFSYRFLFKLRNYAQHLNMPVGLSLNARTGEGGKAIYTFDVEINRDSLLSSGFDWTTLENEIQELPEFISIDNHIKSMMNSLYSKRSVGKSRINLRIDGQ